MEVNKNRKRVRFVGMGSSNHLAKFNWYQVHTIASGLRKSQCEANTWFRGSEWNIDLQFYPFSCTKLRIIIIIVCNFFLLLQRRISGKMVTIRPMEQVQMRQIWCF